MSNHVSIRPQPLIAEILPGFTTLAIISAAYLAKNHWALDRVGQSTNLLALVTALGVGGLIGSWVIGTFLDSCRDLIEWLVDRWKPLNWDFLLMGSAEDVARLNEWYLAYYFLDGNYAVGILLVFMANTIGLHCLPLWSQGLLLLAFVVSLLSAICQRKELSDVMGTGLPHDRVYTRLKPSRIHGVGVFAVTDIVKGTPLFEPDDEKIVWVDERRISELPKDIKKLYRDFGVFKHGKCGVPTSFNKLTVSWYLNEPAEGKSPNVGCDKELKFYALADIKAGDELTVDYSKYSERPPAE
jgi:hypothetical protein